MRRSKFEHDQRHMRGYDDKPFFFEQQPQNPIILRPSTIPNLQKNDKQVRAIIINLKKDMRENTLQSISTTLPLSPSPFPQQQSTTDTTTVNQSTRTSRLKSRN